MATPYNCHRLEDLNQKRPQMSSRVSFGQKGTLQRVLIGPRTALYPLEVLPKTAFGGAVLKAIKDACKSRYRGKKEAILIHFVR